MLCGSGGQAPICCIMHFKHSLSSGTNVEVMINLALRSTYVVGCAADEPITVAFAAPMTAAQQTWLCRTRAYVHTITFDLHDPASALLLTDRPHLHARLEEAHGVCVHYGDDVPALAAAVAVLPRFAALRVLCLGFRGTLIPGNFVMALPPGLRHLTCTSARSRVMQNILIWMVFPVFLV